MENSTINERLRGIKEELHKLNKNLEKPKTGKWIIGEDTGAKMYECSECGCRMIAEWYDLAVGTEGYKYCPYCGAKMEVEHD